MPKKLILEIDSVTPYHALRRALLEKRCYLVDRVRFWGGKEKEKSELAIIKLLLQRLRVALMEIKHPGA
jgi:hypothetical protein